MDVRFSLFLGLPFLLVACASAPKPAEKPPGLTVFEARINQLAAPDSIFREGDIVEYAVLATDDKLGHARFQAAYSQLHPTLLGQAKPVTCEKLKALGWYDRFNYLEDYGVFIPETESNVTGKLTFHVNSAR